MNVSQTLAQSGALLEERCKSSPRTPELRILSLHQDALDELCRGKATKAPKAKAAPKPKKSPKAKATETETEAETPE